jgi:hypothetical protein
VQLLGRALEAAVLGAATWAGIWLAQELRDPTSDVRLRIADLVERLQEVRP